MFNARIHHTSGKLRTGLLVGIAAAVRLAIGSLACTFSAKATEVLLAKLLAGVVAGLLAWPVKTAKMLCVPLVG